MSNIKGFSFGRIFFWIGVALMLFPVMWMVLSAFKPSQELVDYPPTLFPKQWTIEPITFAWFERNFARMMMNSMIVSTSVTVLCVLTSAYIGYVLSKFEFRGRKYLFFVILATMMIPAPVLLIPHFQIILTLDWVNTYWALIAPGIITAFGIFLMYQFLLDFPDELIEAARIEGVSEAQIFFRIVLPLIKSPCVALGIITFLHQWELLLWPIVAASDPSMHVLPVGLATFSNTSSENAALYNPYSAALIAAAPLLILFFFFQKMIVKGIALSGMK